MSLVSREFGDDFILSDGNLSSGVADLISAWLLFSGNKHETFREADELVAIVYDGLYRGLSSHTFAVESDPIQSSSA